MAQCVVFMTPSMKRAWEAREREVDALRTRLAGELEANLAGWNRAGSIRGRRSPVSSGVTSTSPPSPPLATQSKARGPVAKGR